MKTKDVDLTTPPGSPAIGDAYVVAPSAADDWSGKDRSIAVAGDTAGATWSYRPPATGDRIYDEATGLEWVYDGSNWVGIVAPCQLEGYTSSPGTLAASDADWFVYQLGGGSSSTVMGPSAADLELRITLCHAYYSTGATAGTYNVTPFVETQGGVVLATSNFSDSENVTTRRGMRGSIVSPLIKVQGSVDAETWMRSGLRNRSSSVDALPNSIRAIQFYGFWVRVL